jgi:hypothetical protein
MASLDFPSSPANNQVYTLNGVQYYYNGVIGAWLTNLITNPLNANTTNTQIFFNDAGYANGNPSLRFDKFANTLYVSNVAVATNVSAAYFIGDGSKLTGIAVATSYDTANAAYGRANTSAQLAFRTIVISGNTINASSNASTLTIGNSNNIVVLSNTTNSSLQITQNPSGVTPSTYGGTTAIPVIVVDAFGRVTSASNAAAAQQGVTSLSADVGITLTPNPITSTGTIGLAAGVITAQAWTGGISALTTDNYGRVTSVTAAAGYLTSLTGTAGQIFSSGGSTPTVNLISTGVTASTYGGASFIPVLNVDAFGRITGASNVAVQGMDYAYANTIWGQANTARDKANGAVQTAYVTQTANGTSLTPSTNNSTLTISSSNNIVLIANATNSGIQITQSPSGVTASIYGGSTQIPVITVDAYGRLTSAANAAVQGMDYAYANTIWGAANQAGVIANAAFGIANVGYTATNSAFGVINSAFGKANTALQNTSVTLAGSLSATGTLTANSYVYVTAPDGTGNEGGEIQLAGAGTFTGWSLDAYQNNYRVFARTGSTVSNVNFFHAQVGGSIRMGVNRTDPGYTLDVFGTVNASSLLVNGLAVGGDLTPANNWANTKVSSVSGTSGRVTSSGGTTPTIDLATAGAGAASYSSGISALTVDAYGRVTSVTGSASYLTGASTVNIGTTNFALNRASASQSLTGVSIDGSAGSATTASYLSGYQYLGTIASGVWTTDFNNTPAYYLTFGQQSAGGPTGTWWFMENMRHSNATNYWGRQNAWGWEDNANEFYSRNVSGGTWGSWVRFMHSGNFNNIINTNDFTNASLSDSSGTISWDASTGRIATVTLTAAGRTLANPTNLKVGTYILHILQDATGSRTITTWGSAYKFPGGVKPTLSTAANARDILSMVCDGTNLYCAFMPGMA